MIDLTNLKHSRPLLLIILILILVVGGGYYYLYLRKPKPTPPEEVTFVEFEYPKGTVERIESDKLVIRTDTGLLDLLIDEEADVTFEAESLYEVLHGEAASLGDIKVGDNIAASVRVFSDQIREAFFIEILRQE